MTDYATVLAAHGGLLASGSHDDQDLQTCRLCVLELAALARLDRLTDDSDEIGLPDVRGINDAYPDDQSRTAALLPWLEALERWADWPQDRRKRWIEIVALRTVREVLPIALEVAGVDASALAYRGAQTLGEAARAAEAAARVAVEAAARAATVAAEAAADAAAAAAEAAARAAEAAARAAATVAVEAAARAAATAAEAAAEAVAVEARKTVLDLAVRIQIEAAQETAQ